MTHARPVPVPGCRPSGPATTNAAQGQPRVRCGSSPMGKRRRSGENENMTDYTSQTPPPGPSDSRHRLNRSTTDRMVAGVAGGLAEYLDVDPVAVRIGFVVASFLLGGIGGPILYLLMWAIVPEEGKTTSIASEALKSNPWSHSGQGSNRV